MLKTFMSIFIVSLVLCFAASIASLLILGAQTRRSNLEMGGQVAENSEEMLLMQSTASAQSYLRETAALIEQKVLEYEHLVRTLAGEIEYIYENGNATTSKVVVRTPEEIAAAGESRELTMQWWPSTEDVNYDEARQEAQKFGYLINYFQATQEVYPSITSMYVSAEDGLNFAYDDSAYAKVGILMDGHIRPWYTGAAKKGDLYVSDLYDDVFGRGMMLTIAMPYYVNGDLRGVVGIDILADAVSSIVYDTVVGQDGYIMIFSTLGKVVCADGYTEENTDMLWLLGKNGNEVKKTVLGSDSGICEDTIDGSDVTVLHTTIDRYSWKVVAVMPVSTIVAPAQQATDEINFTISQTQSVLTRTSLLADMLMIVLFFVLIIIAMLIIRKTCIKLSDPVIRLTNDVKAIGEGDLDYVSDIRTGDEIEELSRGFESMTVSLKQYISNLSTAISERERIGTELAVATKIQENLLPSIFPPFPDRSEFTVYATMTPAKEVGGDFYDFYLIDDDHLAMVMADVSGKGVPAALFMAIAKTLIKNCAMTGLSPAAVLDKVNKQLCENNDADMFVTVWLGILEISTGHVVAANAGHEYPVIKHAGGQFELLRDKHGFVLAGMDMSRYRDYTFELAEGDFLYLYTDGVPEATDASEELYGTGRMLASLNSDESDAPEDVLHRVRDDVNGFVGEAPQFDDMTMLGLKINGGSRMKKQRFMAELSEVPKAIEFVEGIIEEAGVPMGAAMHLSVATDELFSNIARYSGADEATIGCSAQDGCVTLRFTDNGTAYDPTQKADPDITLSAEDRQIGGLGIFMVKKSMDSMEYEYRDGMNIVTLKKKY